MRISTSRKLHAPKPAGSAFAVSALAGLALAGAVFSVMAATANPAMALCKYGTPNCVNPNPGPKPPTVGGVKIPDSGWEDPDCKYYRNCGYVGSSARQMPSGSMSMGGLKSR